ncbi:hypothetical protein [Mycobacterium sp. OTB74]|uniref:hypothetical protein n=1 Tax=Mycobacterium sp. OTB74 TaxID=1853452 RepID=UPI00247439E0|nr:hypothetical protein [Mycobacterium sp. OTB74]MDH6246989.1 hypothetical protein [Mycobacterium sp. OTB74]
MIEDDDSVAAVVTVVGTTAVKVFVGGALTTIWLAVTVALSVAAEEADESSFTPADADDERPDAATLRFGVATEAAVLPVICVGVDALFEPLFAPPVPTSTPGAAEDVAPADADVDPDPDPEPLPDEPDELEVDPDDVEDDPPEAGAPQATPLPVKTAAPTPSATASPPIRPIYSEAFIVLPMLATNTQPETIPSAI